MQEAIPAEEVCEYTYKVELIEKNKISLVVFNTTTGIKYQRYIEEYSDIWEFLKLNFQHSFSLCFKILVRALLEKDPNFNVSIIHNIDYVILQLSYINDLLGFTIDINVNQYKKDNLQESVNILDYKQNQLEDENKSLKSEIKHIHEELTELKRIINLLGDGFSYDNRLIDLSPILYDKDNSEKGIFRRGKQYERSTNTYSGPSPTYDFAWRGSGWPSTGIECPRQTGMGQPTNKLSEPFINIVVANKLCIKVFHEIINENKLDYDINIFGYNWEKLQGMMKLNGVDSHVNCYWKRIFQPRDPRNKINHYTYDFTWKSFKELFDIKI